MIVEYTRNCLSCGKEFTTIHKRQICCNDYCYSKYYYNTYTKVVLDPKICYICQKEFVPRTSKQVTCGSDKCQQKHAENRRKSARVLVDIPLPISDKKDEWDELTPEQRWEKMTLTEISKEIATLYPGKSFGQVRLLKDQGKLADGFGKGCRQCQE